MESVRREARATQEANVALQRAAQEANKAFQEMVFRLQHGDSAEVARTTRLRELERAFELQSNEMSIMRRERETQLRQLRPLPEIGRPTRARPPAAGTPSTTTSRLVERALLSLVC